MYRKYRQYSYYIKFGDPHSSVSGSPSGLTLSTDPTGSLWYSLYLLLTQDPESSYNNMSYDL